jgi:hypothetical protein
MGTVERCPCGGIRHDGVSAWDRRNSSRREGPREWPIQRVLSTPRTGREARRMAAEWTVLAAGILLVSAFGGGLFLGVLAGFAAQVVLNAGLSRHDRRLARQWAAGADINVNTG